MEIEKHIKVTALLKRSKDEDSSVREIFAEITAAESRSARESGGEDDSFFHNFVPGFLSERDSVVLHFVAGYCATKIQKVRDCCACHVSARGESSLLPKKFSSYTSSLSRGGLVFPSPTVFYIAEFVFLFFGSIISDNTSLNLFLLLTNQQRALLNAVIPLLNKDLCFPRRCLECGGSGEQLDLMVAKTAVNVMLNNFCKRRADILSLSRVGQKEARGKRKLLTLGYSKLYSAASS